MRGLATIATGVCLGLSGLATAADADIEAIKSMAGCYEVHYHFAETISLDPEYQIKPEPYDAYGVEYIAYEQRGEQHTLQHLLATGHYTLKHWRQVWQRQQEDVWEFVSPGVWRKYPVTSPGWTQTVQSVDDSPRYGCTATWTHDAASSSWECATPSPLPRREYSQRQDYNILMRGNTHRVGVDGDWQHLQDNTKVRDDGVVRRPLAQEAGTNQYTKIPAARCAKLKADYQDMRAVWHEIQAYWQQYLAAKDVLEVAAGTAADPLWPQIFGVAQRYQARAPFDEATKAEIADQLEQIFAAYYQ